ncbi:hypothetical protein LTR12_013860 [Friedmanniomyces endolithicus]|nr:hypothetical protein LTR12_013860 [Friedmanniomyces endolithicus]
MAKIALEELQKTSSELKSKSVSSKLARARGFDQMIKISERQEHIGPQPTTLKNTLAAIVGAVWLDSRDYRAVVQVVASLYLVNYAEPSISPQGLTSTSSISPSTGHTHFKHDLGDPLVVTSDVAFDAYIDADMLGPDETSTASHADLASGSLIAEPLLDPIMTGVSAQSGEAEVARHEAQPVSNKSTLAPGPASPTFVNTRFERSATNTCHVAEGNQRSTEPASARTNDSIRSIFEAYTARELNKFQHRPELFARHYHHRELYQEALSSIETAHDKTLANMAVAIGDCSAMITLQQALANIRAPIDSGSVYVRQDMPPEQRLEAIMRLDLCMAHLRLARRLHIYKLYEHLAGQVPGGDTDGFILLSNLDLGLNMSESCVAAPRGNPRNRRQANITTLMTDHVYADNSSGGDRRKSRSYMKRLRRLGQRLQLLVHRWGLGILCLLGAGFTDDL